MFIYVSNVIRKNPGLGDVFFNHHPYVYLLQTAKMKSKTKSVLYNISNIINSLVGYICWLQAFKSVTYAVILAEVLHYFRMTPGNCIPICRSSV